MCCSTVCRCFSDIFKFFLFLINFITWLISTSILAGSILLLFKSKEIIGFHIDTSLSSENPSAIFFSLLLIVIVVSGFLSLFTFLGCCGAACRNRCMLGSFIIILLVFISAEVVAITFMYLHYPDELSMIRVQLKDTIAYYDVVDQNYSIVRLLWDHLQFYGKCCGSVDFLDWRMSEGLKTGRKVPASCCLPGKESECVFNPDAENVYMTGCAVKLELPLRIAFWTLPGLMTFMLVAAIWVCKRANYSPFDELEEYDERYYYDDYDEYYPPPSTRRSANRPSSSSAAGVGSSGVEHNHSRHSRNRSSSSNKNSRRSQGQGNKRSHLPLTQRDNESDTDNSPHHYPRAPPFNPNFHAIPMNDFTQKNGPSSQTPTLTLPTAPVSSSKYSNSSLLYPTMDANEPLIHPPAYQEVIMASTSNSRR